MTNNNDGRPFPDIHEAIRALQDVAEAKDELEAECYRLRAELKTSNAERDELRQQVENIKNGFEGSCYACEPVGEMNKKLRAERDEARREICVLQVLYSRFYHVGEESECAKDREWDCFKETPKPTGNSQ
jgi:chromosome segregation ATPase